MIELTRRNDIQPVCPACKSELSSIWYQTIRSFLGKRSIYYCPQCRAVLGLSHRKAFWTG